MNNTQNNVIVNARIEKISELIKNYYAEKDMDNLEFLFLQIEGLVSQIDKYLKFVSD